MIHLIETFNFGVSYLLIIIIIIHLHLIIKENLHLYLESAFKLKQYLVKLPSLYKNKYFYLPLLGFIFVLDYSYMRLILLIYLCVYSFLLFKKKTTKIMISQGELLRIYVLLLVFFIIGGTLILIKTNFNIWSLLILDLLLLPLYLALAIIILSPIEFIIKKIKKN